MILLDQIVEILYGAIHTPVWICMRRIRKVRGAMGKMGM
jgi:hypothetical protein